MKVMISQPMRGLTDEQIEQTRQEVITVLQNEGHEVINTFFKGGVYDHDVLKSNGIKRTGIYMLAKSLEAMSTCDVMYFCNGWDKARGCIIEHDVAIKYGIPVMYER